MLRGDQQRHHDDGQKSEKPNDPERDAPAGSVRGLAAEHVYDPAPVHEEVERQDPHDPHGYPEVHLAPFVPREPEDERDGPRRRARAGSQAVEAATSS